MSFKEVNRPSIVGECNIQHFVIDENSRLFLKRIPRDNLAIIEQIKTEYIGTHFLTTGGSFRRRSPQEQASFTKQAASNNLRVLVPEYMDGEVAYYSFLEKAQTLDVFFRQPFLSPSVVVKQLFDDLRTAHSLNTIYGDRWYPNMLVTPDTGLIHIDFDIEISGPYAKEFELAQVIYYTVLSGKDQVVSPIRQYLSGSLWCDSKMVADFLHAKTVFFKNTQDGGIEDHIETVIGSVFQEDFNLEAAFVSKTNVVFGL